MTTEQIRERMGSGASTAEAQAMEKLLAGRQPSDVSDAEWFALVAKAAEITADTSVFVCD